MHHFQHAQRGRDKRCLRSCLDVQPQHLVPSILCILPQEMASLVWRSDLPAYLVSYVYASILLQLNAVLHVHLPDGPTAHYKLTNLVLGKDIKVCFVFLGCGPLSWQGKWAVQLRLLLVCRQHTVEGRGQHTPCCSLVYYPAFSSAVTSAPRTQLPILNSFQHHHSK